MTHPARRARAHAHNPAREDPCMSETVGRFKGIRGFLWPAIGLLLLLAAFGSLVYIIVHLG